MALLQEEFGYGTITRRMARAVHAMARRMAWGGCDLCQSKHSQLGRRSISRATGAPVCSRQIACFFRGLIQSINT
jgi:hypothetical protein